MRILLAAHLDHDAQGPLQGNAGLEQGRQILGQGLNISGACALAAQADFAGQ
ncbi:hypothetical protein MBH78_06725 [Oceanimonas sp. NS1]|nr:hypothetical protein [Oceanimonas sp. NS1]